MSSMFWTWVAFEGGAGGPDGGEGGAGGDGGGGGAEVDDGGVIGGTGATLFAMVVDRPPQPVRIKTKRTHVRRNRGTTDFKFCTNKTPMGFTTECVNDEYQDAST